jgi:hypothetical protein
VLQPIPIREALGKIVGVAQLGHGPPLASSRWRLVKSSLQSLQLILVSPI